MNVFITRTNLVLTMNTQIVVGVVLSFEFKLYSIRNVVV